ncbi:MalY/PatB family protein [Salinicoccus roseus]|uniref:MalY/PatB family protein n=1 Tax=Salinicoccus roseus TaxID=45670 RepID=UPI000F4EB862|nr:aminotransferase class I/II-fold pyridoxal phosphate-dependent enzyme [Salinicoccus roseus]RPE53883.1 cystathionine beta-lyase [Salinicoccus roseus]GGA70172.1 cystathionine beta-lyase PatB [Salinicoccus roseus]
MSSFDFNRHTTREGTYSVQYEGTEKLFGTDGLEPFWIADMDIETPGAVQEAMKRRIDNGIFGYTKWQNPKFYEAVKGWWHRRYGIVLEDDEIHYAPSVMFTVGEAVRQFSEEGEGVILTMPSYNAFIGMVKGNGRKIFDCPLLENDDGWQFDFDHFEALCSREDVKVYIHCNPHNPTGRVWKRDELEKIREICLRTGVFLVSDEIHMDFVRPKGQFVSMVELMADGDPMLVTTGLGKTFNLASIPHSYFITRDKALQKKIARNIASRYGMGAANSLALEAIHAAYTECGAWVDGLNSHIEENMQLVEDYITAHMSEWLDFKKPEATYLAWISFEKSGLADEEVHKALIDIGGIAVSPGHIYDMKKNRHFRFNVASSRHRVEDGLERIHRTFKKITKSTVQ